MTIDKMMEKTKKLNEVLRPIVANMTIYEMAKEIEKEDGIYISMDKSATKFVDAFNERWDYIKKIVNED